MLNKIDKGIYWSKSWGLVSGCSPVSESCQNCWLADITYRFQDPLHPMSIIVNQSESPRFTGYVRFREDRLDIPRRTKKPKVFAIWSDLYHEKIPLLSQCKAYLKMSLFPRHIYLILTKRVEIMAHECPVILQTVFQSDTFPDNIWHGVTCETQQRADERIPYLLQVPGKRFLSLEPLLSDIDFSFHFLGEYSKTCQLECDAWENKCSCWDCSEWKNKISAVIVGAESGAHRRLCNIEHIRSVVRQCKNANVPVFVKQIHDEKGRVIKDMNLFPEDLQTRELTWRQ